MAYDIYDIHFYEPVVLDVLNVRRTSKASGSYKHGMFIVILIHLRTCEEHVRTTPPVGLPDVGLYQL